MSSQKSRGQRGYFISFHTSPTLNYSLVPRSQIGAMPTFQFLKGGAVVKEIVGAGIIRCN